MNSPIHPLRAGLVLAVSSTLLLAACQKSDSTASSAPAQAPAAALAKNDVAAMQDAAAKVAADTKKQVDDLAASAKKEADAVVAKAQKEAGEQAAKAEEAMAKMKADAEAAKKQAAEQAMALESKAKAEAAKKKADADAIAAKAAAAAAEKKAAAEAAASEASLKDQASSMLSKYADEIGLLKTGAVALKKLVDQNANLLPENMRSSYSEFQALVPQISSMADSLKGYSGTDLAGMQSKLQTDLGSAKKLYNDLRGMLPAQYGAMLPSL
jgi:uncharacterized membrane protein YqiK